MTVRISVVVPCHDHGHLLGDALESVAAQGIADVEVIVVDDQSTDDTVSVATAHGAAVVPSPGRGAAAARNAGVAASSGELIAFLDADDVWVPGSLGSRIAALEGNAAAYGAVEEFVDAGYDGDYELRNVGPARMAGTMVVTREAWNAVGDIDESLPVGEFIDWVARFDAAGLSAVALDEVVLRRRIHATNTTRANAQTVPAGLLAVARLHRHRQTQ